ncbi:MAG TPA: response regulator transcription factor [Gammaproteobacteria bacterium]|nr:response regulator transcription factor [Gammaproteobacteria bacterium]
MILNALVVEDHDETREWLCGLVAEAFPDIRVRDAATLGQARRALEEQSPGIAVVDINLPDGSGIELIRQLAESSPQSYGIIATIFDDDRHLFAALQAGAQGYLLKDQPRARLCEQLRNIVNGEPPLSPAVARRIMRYFQNQPPPREADTTLSDREKEVLTLVSKGLGRSDISRLLGITPNTAAGYIKTIYRKLNVSSRAEAVLEAVRMGLVTAGRY